MAKLDFQTNPRFFFNLVKWPTNQLLFSGSNFTGFYRRSTGEEIVGDSRTTIERSDNTVTLDIGLLTEDDFDTYLCNDSSSSDHASLEIIGKFGRVLF